ncbi:MAG: TIGR02391 family protein [Cryomorphaceae bacterium]|nr:MAG: TIGR02391 family protein [Cryomorphaceae bacterium]
MLDFTHLHPILVTDIQSHFENGLYTDAVRSAVITFNDEVKRYIKSIYELELDGADLMRKTFSRQKGLLKFSEDDTETTRNVQEGYCTIMAGVMQGIRNPVTHGNEYFSEIECAEILVMISHLLRMFDGAKVNNRIHLDGLISKIRSLGPESFIRSDRGDKRRWVVIEGTIHHIHDGQTHGRIGKLNGYLNSPRKVDGKNISSYKKGKEIVS